MLERLLIENFQCHEILEVSFTSGVNSIIGDTDQGKSASLRALMWLITNQPSRGDFFIRKGCDRTSVTLWIDGHKINRTKGKGVNTYQLDDKVYEAFGNDVPEEISSILNISSISLQRQLDGPFLFNLSPGEVSRELNTVVNLDLIDSVISDIISEQKKAKTEVQVTQVRLDESRQKRDELKWVKEADKDLKEIESIEEDIQKQQQSLDNLESLIEEITSLNSKIKTDDDLIMALTTLIQEEENLNNLEKEVEELDDILNQLIKLDKQIKKNRNQITVYEEELKEELNGRCPLCGSEEEVFV